MLNADLLTAEVMVALKAQGFMGPNEASRSPFAPGAAPPGFEGATGEEILTRWIRAIVTTIVTHLQINAGIVSAVTTSVLGSTVPPPPGAPEPIVGTGTGNTIPTPGGLL